MRRLVDEPVELTTLDVELRAQLDEARVCLGELRYSAEQMLAIIVAAERGDPDLRGRDPVVPVVRRRPVSPVIEALRQGRNFELPAGS